MKSSEETKKELSIPENAFRELKKGEVYMPLMSADKQYKEVTVWSVTWGVIMAVIFSAAAAFLGLKVGQVFEAAIPIAIIAVGLSGATKRKNALGENVIIGEGAFIEPGAVIGHDVIIGCNARIMAGAVIKHAVIGDNFYAGENAVIGTEGFNFAVDSNGHAFRMKALGRIRIGDNVEIGAQSVVACALAGYTEIGSNTKIDTYSQVSHDCTLGGDCEICGGVMFGGFVQIGERVFVGANVATKNRISIGDDAFVALGSTVLKNVEKGEQVFGNPARVIRK